MIGMLCDVQYFERWTICEKMCNKLAYFEFHVECTDYYKTQRRKILRFKKNIL